MLGVTSGSELVWNRREWTVRKRDKGMTCEFGSNYLSTKIAWKFQLKKQLSIYSEVIWNYANISFHHSKIKNPHLNSESLTELKNFETEISLKRFLKKTIYGGNDLYWKLTLPTLTNVKSISSHCRKFQLTIFLRQATFSDRHFS